MTLKVGDIVSRVCCEYEVLEVFPGENVITVQCIKAPSHRWIEYGLQETKAAICYSFLRSAPV